MKPHQHMCPTTVCVIHNTHSCRTIRVSALYVGVTRVQEHVMPQGTRACYATGHTQFQEQMWKIMSNSESIK